MDTLFYKTGDELPVVIATIRQNGTAVDLSGYSTVAFSMCVNDGDRTAVLSEAEADFVTDGSDGKVMYEWGGTDLADEGEYLAEFVLIDGEGKKYSMPKQDLIKIVVTPSLGEPTP